MRGWPICGRCSARGVNATGPHVQRGRPRVVKQLLGAAVPDLLERALRDVADFAQRVS